MVKGKLLKFVVSDARGSSVHGSIMAKMDEKLIDIASKVLEGTNIYFSKDISDYWIVLFSGIDSGDAPLTAYNKRALNANINLVPKK